MKAGQRDLGLFRWATGATIATMLCSCSNPYPPAFVTELRIYGKKEVWEGVSSITVEGAAVRVPPTEVLESSKNNTIERITLAVFRKCTNDATFFRNEASIHVVVSKNGNQVHTDVPRIACKYVEHFEPSGMREITGVNLLPDGKLDIDLEKLNVPRQFTSCSPEHFNVCRDGLQNQ